MSNPPHANQTRLPPHGRRRECRVRARAAQRARRRRAGRHRARRHDRHDCPGPVRPFCRASGRRQYDGIWVGENSKIRSIGGIRTSLVEALKKIKAPVVRWPGGCFADSYDWRNGDRPTTEPSAPNELLGEHQSAARAATSPIRITSARWSSRASAALPAHSHSVRGERAQRAGARFLSVDRVLQLSPPAPRLSQTHVRRRVSAIR